MQDAELGVGQLHRLIADEDLVATGMDRDVEGPQHAIAGGLVVLPSAQDRAHPGDEDRGLKGLVT